jgi:cytochrome c553
MRGGLQALLMMTALAGANSTAVAADRELGKYLSTECVTCHRSAPVQGIPRIGGWPENQFIAVMNAYKDKQRDNPVMQTIAGRLGAGDIAALAAYFREQK